jgi:hypothetical protein
MSLVGIRPSSANFAAERLLRGAASQAVPTAGNSSAPALAAALGAASAVASDSKPAPSSNDSAHATTKPAYPAQPEIPTQPAPKGFRFDFNDGARVMLPEGEHPWWVRLSDIDAGNILFETEIKAGADQQRQAILHRRSREGGHTRQFRALGSSTRLMT